MTSCYYCGKKGGDMFDRLIPICHPATSVNKVKVCKNCRYFAKTDDDTKERLIK